MLLDIVALKPLEHEESNDPVEIASDALDDAEYLLGMTRGETLVELSLEAVVGKDPEERLQYLVEQLIKIKFLPPEVTLSQVRNFIRGFRGRSRSVVQYNMRPYPGTITLIRVTKRPPVSKRSAAEPDDETLGFAGLSPEPVPVYFVHGATHDNMVHPPYVEELKDIVRECIEKVDLRMTD